jgi:hypothetical protein
MILVERRGEHYRNKLYAEGINIGIKPIAWRVPRSGSERSQTVSGYGCPVRKASCNPWSFQKHPLSQGSS